MSLWLQSAIDAMSSGDYKHFRQALLPRSPIPIPKCMIRELEYGERCCNNSETDCLFPIRFIWLLEAVEQKNFGYSAGVRSRYNPEKLLNVWDKVSTDEIYRQELSTNGFRFDFMEKAINLTMGWVLIGDHFPDDLIEVENTIKIELLFPYHSDNDLKPAFQEIKRQRCG
jgi:hypothetical protein